MSQLTSEADPADHFVSAERALGSVTCHHVNDWLTNDDVDQSELGFINIVVHLNCGQNQSFVRCLFLYVRNLMK